MISEETAATQTASEKPVKKARTGAQRANVAPKKAKPGKKRRGHPRQESAQSAQGREKGRRRPRRQQDRQDSGLLKRDGGGHHEGTA